jgi:hypothetical protein
VPGERRRWPRSGGTPTQWQGGNGGGAALQALRLKAALAEQRKTVRRSTFSFAGLSVGAA